MTVRLKAGVTITRKRKGTKEDDAGKCETNKPPDDAARMAALSITLNAGDRSLADNLHQHALAAVAVEFAEEDLLPRAEFEFAFRDRDHDFAAHDLTLEMRVRVVAQARDA